MRALRWVPVLLLAACTATQQQPLALPTPTPVVVPTTPAPVATTPAPTPAPTPTGVPTLLPWVVGASPLPLRADGFGQVLPTPKQLRDRRLQAVDTLPAPRDSRFHGTVVPLGAAVLKRMGDTYRPGCPVGAADLRYLQVSFHGFDGRAHTGELVVNASVADDVVRAFHSLYDTRFPIEQMRLPTTADVTAKPTGDGNDTAGFVCRAARGQKRFSAHAYGLAVDINPFQNPEKKGGLVLPELASAYTDRTWVRPGMFVRGSASVRALTAIGWTWGGTFRSIKDYMHFSADGR